MIHIFGLLKTLVTGTLDMPEVPSGSQTKVWFPNVPETCLGHVSLKCRIA